MKRVITFLQQLHANNDRVWFNAHKDEYNACKQIFEDFVRELIDGIRQFDDSIPPLEIKDCTYRIYRDTRFSKDKTPYKTHMGAFIAPGGKKSGFAGYYFQVGAIDGGFPSGCILATGDYMCLPQVVKILREDIDIDEGHDFMASVRQAEENGFSIDFDQALKRVPAPYAPDKPYSDYLRLKNFCLIKNTGLEYMSAPALLDRILSDFKSTTPFLTFLNRAIDYVKNGEV